MHQVKWHCQSKRHTDRMKDMKRQPRLQAILKNTATQTFQDQVIDSLIFGYPRML